MRLTAPEAPVCLERLDHTGEPAFATDAQLAHMDTTHALVLLDGPPGERWHWGAPVRFHVEDGQHRYQVTGSIVARTAEPPCRNETSGSGEPVPPPIWELRIRIWDCTPTVQRRARPRRRLGFRVDLRGACGPDAAEGPAEPSNAIVAWCLDVGAGGIRVRTGRLATVPPRMRLEFCLPAADGDSGAEASHKFSLAGRVIRALPQGRGGEGMDIALCFEGLSVRDGMALHNLLA